MPFISMPLILHLLGSNPIKLHTNKTEKNTFFWARPSPAGYPGQHKPQLGNMRTKGQLNRQKWWRLLVRTASQPAGLSLRCEATGGPQPWQYVLAQVRGLARGVVCPEPNTGGTKTAIPDPKKGEHKSSKTIAMGNLNLGLTDSDKPAAKSYQCRSTLLSFFAVFAFVCVLCPHTGRPIACLLPT